VVLRAPTERDAEPLFQILHEPEVGRFWAGYDLQRVQSELIASDGESNWLEGAQLMAVYGIIATAVWYL